MNASNGSRQSWQRHSALQAVAPNSASVSTRALPQRGQARSPGGAIPMARKLARPASEIAAVPQAGASSVRTITGPSPARSIAAVTSQPITAIAGQPV